MSGQWPPEWEDSNTGLPDEWDIDDAGFDQESSAVASFLASVPSPVLPAAFEARISAAIAAEATARADGAGSAGAGPAGPGVATAGPDDAETTGRSSSPEVSSPAATESGSAASARHRRRRSSIASRRTAAGSRPTGSRPNGRRRRLRMPSAQVSGSLVILLFIAGFVLLITQFGSGSSSSGSTGLASGASTASSAASAAAPASGTSGTSQGRYTGSNSEPSIFRVGANVRSLKFTVSQSGTSYHASTLAGQVRNQLNAQNGVTPAASAPNPTSSDGQVESSASSTAPAPANPTPSLSLKGCVSALTKGVTPCLVDQATYDGIPAYIIAVPSRVWVVRLGCTAAHPQEITSVSLPGLSGNLSALGSVEWYASPEERRME